MRDESLCWDSVVATVLENIHKAKSRFCVAGLYIAY